MNRIAKMVANACLVGALGFLGFVFYLVLTEEPPVVEKAEPVVEQPAAHYIQDPRTGFCFAFSASNERGLGLVKVPCTPEVERLVPNE